MVGKRGRGLLLGVALAGLTACGAGGDGGASIPDAIREVAQHREVEPFTGWSVPGVTLYRVSFSVPDRSEASVIGLDDASGAVLRGPGLMRRIGARPPDELARRVFDVLLGQQGGAPITAEDRGTLGTDAEWATVAPAHLEDGALVFFGWRGEMAPELVEHRVDTTTWEMSTRSATEVIVASGRRAAVGGARCMPRSTCGCWSGCAAYQLVRAPGRSPDEAVFVAVGEEDGPLYAQRRHCTTLGGRETCARVCRVDSPTAQCDDAIVAEEEECTEACPPTEAPYHCELLVEGCRRVDHPIRAAEGDRAP
ncbi:MAG: hypothetical protein H6719_07670 [Sandaracinaceae bacterium]|nr:hypothetical protein [Sandaracinaceae bacterium]